ncbi:MAG: hypothetical protein JNL97_11665 [Verrucomicrobiales bacterium]|nr:hypothetical protein [Verrucomicrobiales bacterium]
MNAKRAREEINVEMLDKAQELMRQQGEAMIRVIEDARKPGDPPPFEALA